MSTTYDIFISSKNLDQHGLPTRDSVLAREVYDFLSSHGLNVFLSNVSLEKSGVAIYKKAIDEALDAARVLIAVGTSAENLNSQWVRYEWDSFLNDILSGVKKEGRVFTYVEGVAPLALPRGLRQVQVFSHNAESMQRLYNFIANITSSSEETDNKPRLRLIRGGQLGEMVLGSVRIVAAPEDTPPFTIEAVAVEEDTFLVLSANPEVRVSHEESTRLMTELLETRPAVPGSVLVKGKRPLRFFAIVHDLNQEPSWREEWIASALDKIFQEAESRKLQSLALPLLGTLHGSLEKQRFVVLLRRALEQTPAVHLKLLWLIMPCGTNYDIFSSELSSAEKINAKI